MSENVAVRRGRLMLAEESKYYYYCKTFWYSLAVACLITIPFIVWEWIQTGHGIFLYYGDYNAQQIAFYKQCVEMVRSGDFGWDWYTDMGSNFVGSYSYYMLGSPFFWLMCLFPSSWAPYLMGPMYIIKYVVAALIAYAYLQRWVKNKNYAVLGSLLYAFCGFQIYNTFFNQFHEVVALFPLLLIGMEEYIQNNRKGIFAIAVCLNAMVNYFMFAGQVVFCVIYFLFRFSDRTFRVTVKNFLGLALEAVLGFAMSMILFLPGALALLGNDRTSRSFSELKNILAWWKNGGLYWQRYGQILESYFFPPDIPSRVNFFYGHTERWASISAYLPLFGMTGVFAFFTTKKRGWLKALIPFLIVCSFVPGLNSLFFLTNSSYYARWMYLMVMMMVVATIIALDSKETRWKGALTAGMVAIAAIAVPLGLLWYDDPSTDATDVQLGRAPFPVRFWIYTAIAVAGILLLWYVIKHYKGTKLFSGALIGVTCLCIVVYSCVHITNGKQHSHTSEFMVDQVINGEDVILPDAHEEFYRIDFYRTSSISTIDNLNMYWGYPSIECFHTVVPPSLMTFYDLLGYNRSVGSRTYSSWYGLRAMTSTEYSFILSSRNKREEKTIWEGTLAGLEEIVTIEGKSDWTLVKQEDSVRIFKNGDETKEIRLYDPEALSSYEKNSLWERLESIEGYRLFRAEELDVDGEETTVYHLVDVTDTQTVSRLENDPNAKEIILSDYTRLYQKAKANGVKVTYEQVDLALLPEIKEYLEDSSWAKWEKPQGFKLLYNLETGEFRLLSEESDADQLNTLLATDEWEEQIPSEDLLIFSRETAEGAEYARVYLPELESLASYEKNAGYVRVGISANYRVFASNTETQTYRLVAKDDTYNLAYYTGNSDWTELANDETHRLYRRTRNASANGEMLYAVGSLYNLKELEIYENDPAWTAVGDKEGYRTYSKEEFKLDKGWSYYDTQNGFDIYHNDNYLTMGFSYKGFMTETEFKKISSGFQRSVLLCTYLVVPDDMADYYAQFMDEYVDDPGDEGCEGKLKRKAANYNTFQNSVEERKTMSCTDFEWSSDGFSAKYSSNETDIVFFSVPAEGGWYGESGEGLTGLLTGTGGWTATVNGKEAEILTVFGGFMAVEVPAGENNEIEFTYVTFGSGLGTWITVIAILAFAAYLFVLYKKKSLKADYPFFDGTYYEAGDTAEEAPEASSQKKGSNKKSSVPAKK